MSKRESINRQILVMKKIRQKPMTFKEITNYLEIESNIQGYNFVVSQRTFQRDLEDIRVTFNFDIQFDHSQKKYYLADDFSSVDSTDRIIEAFDTFNALNSNHRVADVFQFEKRKPKGTEYLSGIIYAIKSGQTVEFSYQKFWEDENSTRLIFPVLIKEFNNRWYVVGEEVSTKTIKTFGIDRIIDFKITNEKYSHKVNFNKELFFKNYYGIITPSELTPEKIVLSFNEIQSKYIKTLPLHESQQIKKETEDEMIVELYLCVTDDFIMELMSYGAQVKVIEPKSLQNNIKFRLKRALEQY
jgi:predicted DNA-binding transcriptional regulator YafY